MLALLILLLSGDFLWFLGMESRHRRVFYKDQEFQARIQPEKGLFFHNREKSSPSLKFTTWTPAGFIGVTHSGEIHYRMRRRASLHGFLQAGIIAAPLFKEKFLNGRAPRVLGRGRRLGAPASYPTSEDPGGAPLPGFSIVDFGEVYSGIHVKLRLRGHRLEKMFCIFPGGEPNRILIRVKGADRLSVDRMDGLKVRVEGIDMTFSRPQAFQIINGRYQAVEAAFRVRGRTYGFKLGHYDPDFPLLIEPAWIDGR